MARLGSARLGSARLGSARLGFYCVLTLVGCPSGKGSDPPPPGDGEVVGDYAISESDWATECLAARPEPRRFHQMAWFQRDEGVPYVLTPSGREVRTERGFLVLGGEDSSGVPLDDLWLFDIGRSRMDGACPWRLLQLDATPTEGVADGLLVWDDGNDAFYLVGGRVWDVGGWRPNLRDLRLPVEEPLGMFSSWGETALGDTYRVEVLGAAECLAPTAECGCLDAGGCSGVGWSVNVGDPINTWSLGSGDDLDARRRAICDQVTSPSWEHLAGDTPDLACILGHCDFGCPNAGGLLGACALDPLCAVDSDHLVGAPPVASNLTDVFVPGRFAFGGAWDPVQREALVYGGAVGCTGTACTSVTPLHHDPDLALSLQEALGALSTADGRAPDDPLHAANAAWLTVVQPHQHVAFDVAEVDLDPAPTPLPGAATVGVRGAAAAVLGVDWQFDVKGWTGRASLAVWGGTLDQDVLPQQQLSLLDPEGRTSEMMVYGALDAYADTDAEVLVGGADKFALFRDTFPDPYLGTVWGYEALAGEADEGVLHAAAVGIGPHRFAAVGGIAAWTDFGAGSLHVVDDAGVVQVSAAVSAGYGARGVYDPIDDRAYFFGAFEVDGGTEARVIELQHLPDRPRYLADAVPFLARYEAQLGIEDPSTPSPEVLSTWLADIGMEVALEAGAEDLCQPHCYTDRVTLQFAPDWFDPARVEVDLLQGGEPVRLDLDVNSVAFDPATGWSSATFLSPVSLLTGHTHELQVHLVEELAELRMDGLDPEAIGDGLAWAQLGSLGSCGAGHAIVAGRWPVLTAGAYLQPAFRFEGIRVLPPDDWEVVAPGTRDVECTGLGFQVLDPADPAFSQPASDCFRFGEASSRAQVQKEFPQVLILSDAAFHGSRDLGQARGTANVWIDPCLGGNEQAEVAAYVDGLLRADAEFVAARVGDDTAAGATTPDRIDPIALFVGRAFVATDPQGKLGPWSTVGTTLAGSMTVTPFNLSGLGLFKPVPPGRMRFPVGETVTHELVHVFTERRGHEAATSWLREALPSLVASVRYPALNADRLYAGHHLRVGAVARDLHNEPRARFFANLEEAPTAATMAHRDDRDYQSGPALLAMASAMHGSLDGDALWDAVQDLNASEAWGSEIAVSEVRPWFDAAALDGYDVYVTGSLLGQPVLGLGAVGAGSVEVVQVQGSLRTEAGFAFAPEFPNVPYVLGCDGELGVPFAECGASFGAATGAPPRGTSAASSTVPLTPLPGFAADTGLSTFEGSFALGLMTPWMLLPENVPTYGVFESGDVPPVGAASVAPTWFLVCSPGFLGDPQCLLDQDGDGWPDDGDCEPNEPSAHPGLQDPAPPALWQPGAATGGALGPLGDYNCDGAPLDWWSI